VRIIDAAADESPAKRATSDSVTRFFVKRQAPVQVQCGLAKGVALDNAGRKYAFAKSI
jgi:hypothetical protein